jgi:transposase-like protein
MGKRRRFSAEFKARVVLEVLSGAKTSAEVCREHRLSPQLLNTWKRHFLDNAAQVFAGEAADSAEAQRVAELERRVGRLTMQLEIAKKASAILTSPPFGNGNLP